MRVTYPVLSVRYDCMQPVCIFLVICLFSLLETRVGWQRCQTRRVEIKCNSSIAGALAFLLLTIDKHKNTKIMQYGFASREGYVFQNSRGYETIKLMKKDRLGVVKKNYS